MAENFWNGWKGQKWLELDEYFWNWLEWVELAYIGWTFFALA